MDKLKNYVKLLFDTTFLRFVTVGVINTLFGTTIMFLLYNLLLYPYTWGYWASTAANYLFGSILSYILNKKFTFRYTERGIKPAIRFAATIGVCYLLSYAVAKPVMRLILSPIDHKLQENIAMLNGMVFFVLLNYLGQRFFAFKKQLEAENGD